MSSPAKLLSEQLSHHAEAVCRHYLSNGHKQGNFWLVGDVMNTPGRSLYVRLVRSSHCPAGKWTDAATGEHGDLLDLITCNRGYQRLRDALDEARKFLGEPAHLLPPKQMPAPRNSPEAARRLWAMTKPITGTVAETYLHSRALAHLGSIPALRFHPGCFHRQGVERTTWPAMIAGITDLAGHITGVHRTWLARNGLDKAPLLDQRRALGHLLGNGVRFGIARDALAAGEGIETMLTIRALLPALPCVAALSANHLALIELPAGLCRLYIAVDNDAAGRAAAERLSERATASGVAVRLLEPERADWNADLMATNIQDVLARLIDQLDVRDAPPP
jgi:hypothetical protein